MAGRVPASAARPSSRVESSRFMIIARTDARSTDGMQAAIDRASADREASRAD
jgi:2-methylisocitrate lyase-like PEP mutase family enzyme